MSPLKNSASTALTINVPGPQQPSLAPNHRPTEFTPVDISLQRKLSDNSMGATVHAKFEAKYSEVDSCFLIKGFNGEITKAPEQIKELATLALWAKGVAARGEIKPFLYEVDTRSGPLPTVVSEATRAGDSKSNLEKYALPADGSALQKPVFSVDPDTQQPIFTCFMPAYGFSAQLNVVQGIAPLTDEKRQQIIRQAAHNHLMEHADYIDAYRAQNNLPKEPQLSLADVSKAEGYFGSPAHKEYAAICSARTGGAVPASVFMEIEPYGGLAGPGPKVVGPENPNFGFEFSGGVGKLLSKTGLAHDCDLCLARYFDAGPLAGKIGGTAPGDFKGATGLTPFGPNAYLSPSGNSDWSFVATNHGDSIMNNLYTPKYLKYLEDEQEKLRKQIYRN